MCLVLCSFECKSDGSYFDIEQVNLEPEYDSEDEPDETAYVGPVSISVPVLVLEMFCLYSARHTASLSLPYLYMVRLCLAHACMADQHGCLPSTACLCDLIPAGCIWQSQIHFSLCIFPASRSHAILQVYEELDEKLLDAFPKYLAERGVDADLGAYILALVNDKEQREYKTWLKNVKKFISK